jgi:hypothetical protein
MHATIPRQHFPNIVSTWSIRNYATTERRLALLTSCNHVSHGNTIIVFFLNFLYKTAKNKWNFNTFKYRTINLQNIKSRYIILLSIGRLLRPDIVHFRSACGGTEIFLRELALLNTLSSNPKSSLSVGLAFSHKLLFYFL